MTSQTLNPSDSQSIESDDLLFGSCHTAYVKQDCFENLNPEISEPESGYFWSGSEHELQLASGLVAEAG